MFKEYIHYILLIIIILMFGLGYHLYMKYNEKYKKLNNNIKFIKSDSFQGYKPGYIFKMDSSGLGYYLDK